MNFGIFTYILWPFVMSMYYWYTMFGLLDESLFNTLYGLYEGNWIDFPKIVLTSLSGSGYFFFTDGGIILWSVIVLIFAICSLSIPLDTFLTNITIQKTAIKQNTKKTEKQIKKSEKWFTGIYSFWRLLLPDFLITGPLLAWIFKIQMSPKQILRLNIIIQLIRAGLFIGFACLFKFL